MRQARVSAFFAADVWANCGERMARRVLNVYRKPMVIWMADIKWINRQFLISSYLRKL